MNEALKARRAVKSSLGIKVTTGPPFVTIALVAINVAVYLYGMVPGVGNLFAKLGMWPHYDPRFPYVDGGAEWWRWITSGFVHLSILHIGMNMFVLWVFGQQVEKQLGHLRYGILYATSLLGGSAMVALLGRMGSNVGGASGAIYGLVAAYVAIAVSRHLPFGAVAAQAGAWLVLGFFLPGIAWQGHLGGALAGWVTAAIILRLATRSSTTRGRPR